MDVVLSDVEARVLGTLIEKQLTTPEYYPLSLNALTNACNQKSNRNPVMSLLEGDVLTVLDSLRGKRLAWELKTAGGRVTKYEHNLTPRWEMLPQEIAVLCVLLLRGPQTAGEIRGRTGRMFDFGDLSEVQETLMKLAKREDGPFVVELARLAGTKESRYAHLFCGEPQPGELLLAQATAPDATGPAQSAERLEALESDVAALREELHGVKEQFERFRTQFE